MHISTSNFSNKWGCSRLPCLRLYSLSGTNLKSCKRPQKWGGSDLHIKSKAWNKQANLLANPNPNPSTQQPNTQVSEHTDEPMEMEFCGPLPPQFGQSVQFEYGSDLSRSDHSSEHSEPPKQVCSGKAKNTQTKESTRLGPNIFHSHLQRNQILLFKPKSLLSPRGLPLSKTNSKQIQTPFFIGR